MANELPRSKTPLKGKKDGKKCIACGRKIDPATFHVTCVDGCAVCHECLSESGVDVIAGLELHEASQVLKLMEDWRVMLPIYVSTASHCKGMLDVDAHHRLFKVRGHLYRFSNLAGFELLEDGESTVGTDFNGVVGIFLGAEGAPVASATSKRTCKSLELRIDLRKSYYDSDCIPLLSGGASRRGRAYKKAQDEAAACMAELQRIYDATRQGDA